MKQTQLQLQFSPLKMKAIQTWTCGRLLLQWGTHSGVSAESASRGIEYRTASVVLIVTSAWRKFAHRRRTARRSRAVAIDLPLFARIFIQLRVLDGAERLFGHDQAPSNRLTQQVRGNLGFSPLAILCPVDESFLHGCCFLLQVYTVFGQSQSSYLINTNVEIPRSLETDESLHHPFGACRTCCSRKRNKRPFSASPSNSVDSVMLSTQRSSRRSKALKMSGQETRRKADTENGRVEQFYQNLPQVRNSESCFTSTCLYLGRGFVRPATGQRKKQG